MNRSSDRALAAAHWFVIESGGRWNDAIDFFLRLQRATWPVRQQWRDQPLTDWASGWAGRCHTQRQVWLWALPLTDQPLEHVLEAIATVRATAPGAVQLACFSPEVSVSVRLAFQEAGVTTVVSELWSLQRLLDG